LKSGQLMPLGPVSLLVIGRFIFVALHPEDRYLAKKQKPDLNVVVQPLDPSVEAKMDPNFMMKVIGDRAPARGLPVKHPLMHLGIKHAALVSIGKHLGMFVDCADTRAQADQR
jgi:hypothetical protein